LLYLTRNPADEPPAHLWLGAIAFTFQDPQFALCSQPVLLGDTLKVRAEKWRRSLFGQLVVFPRDFLIPVRSLRGVAHPAKWVVHKLAPSPAWKAPTGAGWGSDVLNRPRDARAIRNVRRKIGIGQRSGLRQMAASRVAELLPRQPSFVRLASASG
jgi:hypothetical protein